MEIRKDVQLIEVEYSSDYKKVTFTFLDEDKGEVLEVNFNRQSFDNGKYYDDDEKAARVDEWCEKYFELPYDELNQAIGVRKDVYHYEKFNSLWESTYPEKFTEDQQGEILNCTIDSVVDDGKMILINYKSEDGKLYQSKMTYAKYVEARKEWFVDAVKKDRQFAKFKDKFGVEVSEANSIVGKSIMVEVKKAFKFFYGDIKKPAWGKQ